MLIDMPWIHIPTAAPTIASGTVVMITNGTLKLSNCAASTRNTTSNAPPSVQYIDWLDFRYSLASPSYDSFALGGSCVSTERRMKSTASPIEKPGASVEVTAIERSRSKRLRDDD